VQDHSTTKFAAVGSPSHPARRSVGQRAPSPTSCLGSPEDLLADRPCRELLPPWHDVYGSVGRAFESRRPDNAFQPLGTLSVCQFACQPFVLSQMRGPALAPLAHGALLSPLSFPFVPPFVVNSGSFRRNIK